MPETSDCLWKEKDGRCRVPESDYLFTALMNKVIKSNKGFTLVEIMIVVAIIALLASIAVPGFLRSRKRAQATRVLEDLRLIDSAVDQYAVETSRTTGFAASLGDVKGYLKVGSPLYNSGCDLFGNSYGTTFTVDGAPSVKVPAATFTALSDVADSTFWGSYYSAP